MNTKQALLQFVQQIMHEGIDALIDRIANRMIEKLDEARMSMPQTAAEYDDELPQPKEFVKPQPNNTRVRDKDCVKNRVKRANIVRSTLC